MCFFSTGTASISEKLGWYELKFAKINFKSFIDLFQDNRGSVRAF